MEKNLTALMCAFVKSYHQKQKNKIYENQYSSLILSDDEYQLIASNLIKGINFFFPDFHGTDEEGLNLIINCQLGPSIIARSIFCEDNLKRVSDSEIYQYLIFAAGYDMSAYKFLNKNIKVFEIDTEEMIEDKIKRLRDAKLNNLNVYHIGCDFTKEDWIIKLLNSKYDKNIPSFCSLLGIIYYLQKENFKMMIKTISNNISRGSYVVFDYPSLYSGNEAKKNEMLAKTANEEMKAKYSDDEMKDILDNNDIEIISFLDDFEITEKYLYQENEINNSSYQMIAPKGVKYILGRKR